MARIQEYDRRWRGNGYGINEREQQYVHMKGQPKIRNMQMAVRVCARVRLIVSGGCLRVRGSKGMKSKYDDDLCVWRTKKQRYMSFLGVNAMTW